MKSTLMFYQFSPLIKARWLAFLAFLDVVFVVGRIVGTERKQNLKLKLQWKPLYVITLGLMETDQGDQIIQMMTISESWRGPWSSG